MNKCACGKPAVAYYPLGNACVDCDRSVKEAQATASQQIQEVEDIQAAVEEEKRKIDIHKYEIEKSATQFAADSVVARIRANPSQYASLVEKLNLETRLVVDGMIAKLALNEAMADNARLKANNSQLRAESDALTEQIKILRESRDRFAKKAEAAKAPKPSMPIPYPLQRKTLGVWFLRKGGYALGEEVQCPSCGLKGLVGKVPAYPGGPIDQCICGQCEYLKEQNKYSQGF